MTLSLSPNTCLRRFVRKIKRCFLKDDVASESNTNTVVNEKNVSRSSDVSQNKLAQDTQTGMDTIHLVRMEMDATRESISKFQTECQEMVDENLDDIDIALKRIVNIAFKMMALVHETNESDKTFSGSPTAKRIDEILHETIDIQKGTLDVVYRTLQAKEKECKEHVRLLKKLWLNL